MFEIGSSAAEMNEFVAVFGQRYAGLIDNAGVYAAYRVPHPQAPYPQDYIIDQQGYVVYWSDEYDPQKIMKIIDHLLLTGTEEQPARATPVPFLTIRPNPCRTSTKINIEHRVPSKMDEDSRLTDGTKSIELKIYDASGRLVNSFALRPTQYAIRWNGTDQSGRPVPSGVYFIRLQAGAFSAIRSITVAR